MLDSLMLDLANAEQEQERWFNKSVSGAREEEATEHIETIAEEDEDSDMEDAEEKPETQISTVEVDSDMEEDDETDSELTLTRTPSRHSPPALSADSDSDSEDESMPSSPEQPSIDSLDEKRRQAIATTSFYDLKESASLSPVETEVFEEEGFFLPSRQQPTIIAAY
jgi:C1A family cysteine protease